MQITENLTPYNHDSGRAGHNVEGIVLHTMVGSIDSAQNRFFNPAAQVSTNYGIGLDGEIRRWVSEGDTAYGNGNYQSNLRTISIEHEDRGDFNGARTDALYNSSSDLVADLCRRYGIACDRGSIKGHNEVIDTRYYPGGTACPDALDLDRIVREANAKLAPPTPPPAPAVPEKAPAVAGSTYTRLSVPLSLVANKQPTSVYNLDAGSWGALSAAVVKQLNNGDPFVAVGKAQHPLGGVYFMTEYSFGQADQTGSPAHNNGVNTVDLSPAPVVATPVVVPDAPAAVTPTPQAPPATPPPIVVADEHKVPVTVIPSDPNAWKTKLDTSYAGKYTATSSLQVKSLTGPDEQELVSGQPVRIAGQVEKDGVKYFVTPKSIETGKYFGLPPITLKELSLDEDEQLFNLNIAADLREELGKLNGREKVVKTAASIDGFVHKFFHKE